MSLSATISAGARIIADVAVYRLRKREAANLGTTLTLAFALRLLPVDLALRAAFAVVLNVFVYLVNDCYDVGIDLRAPGRDNARTRFLAANIHTGWGVCALLAAGLVAMGALRGGALLPAAAVNIVVIVAYSATLKHRPGLDIVAMGLWGVSMAMAGFPVGSVEGWRLAGLLGLLSMVTESVQVLRDEPSDRAAGVRTTAVVLGTVRTARLARALVIVAALYAWVGLHAPLAALLLLPGATVRLEPASAARSWDVLRVLFGLAWLYLLAAHWLHGARW